MGLARSTYYDEPEIQPIDEARLVEPVTLVDVVLFAHWFPRWF